VGKRDKKRVKGASFNVLGERAGGKQDFQYFPQNFA